MIVCPRCGANTAVTETRYTYANTSARRRRRCVKAECGERITTVEVIVGSLAKRGFTENVEDLVVISRGKLKRLHEIVTELVEATGLTGLPVAAREPRAPGDGTCACGLPLDPEHTHGVD
jgi:hypothetical protein